MGLDVLVSNLGLPLALVVYFLYSKKEDDKRRDAEMQRLRGDLAACGSARRKEALAAMETYVQAIGHLEKALKHAILRNVTITPMPAWKRPEMTGETPPSDMAFTRTPPTPTAVLRHPSATVRDPSEITTTIIPRTPRPANIHIRPEDHQ